MKSPLASAALVLQELDRMPGYGTELLDRISQRTGIDLAQGTVFNVLLYLRSEGLISLSGKEPSSYRGGRKRIIYEITEKGRQLAAWQRKVIELAVVAGDGS